MQLGSLANLEREKLRDEHGKLLADIKGYLHLLFDEANIRQVVRDDLLAMKEKYGNKRRTEISEVELGDVNQEDLIAEEPMVVTLSRRGYVKRMPLNTYQAQNRGGRGITGTKADEEDAVEHLFVSSTHDWLLFFTDKGKVLWEKVYNLPMQGRTSKGRALINLLSLPEGDKISACVAVREFDETRFLFMATKNGLVKKTPLSAYKRPTKGGIIAINLREGDELIEALLVSPGDNVLLATSSGMAIRFAESDARSMGRNTSGVKGIKLTKGATVVGMVLAEPTMSLLTVCENGYGKRTAIGTGIAEGEEATVEETPLADDELAEENGVADEVVEDVAEDDADAVDEVAGGEEAAGPVKGYRRQRRGGQGLKDIKATTRNGPVVKVLAVSDQDDVLMVTAVGKIQRIRAGDVNEIGRNTQGVRVIRLDEADKLVSVARIPSDLCGPGVTDAPAPTEEPPAAPTGDSPTAE